MQNMINFKLYPILDKGVIAGKPLDVIVNELIKGGSKIIQYRDKVSSYEEIVANCCLVKKITDQHRVALIINDHLNIAAMIGAAGVHLGQDDTPIRIAKRILGPGKIIGVSTHNYKQAITAQQEGADYIGIGPIFVSPTKKNKESINWDEIRQIVSEIKIPVVAIGGITLENIDKILAVGIKRVAVISAILRSNNIQKTVSSFLKKIGD